MRTDTPLVSIKCLVYNHAPYLRQCLDGFIMQKTNFKFEAVIHEDCSTDGSASIIREYEEKYPDIIKPIYEKENQYSKRDGSLNRIIDPHLTGKYIAICEGDDYWTDPLKLQKQVDFLERNPDYGFIYTAYREERNGRIGEIKRTDFGIDCLRQYLKHEYGIIATASTLFKANLFHQREIDLSLPMADVPLWIQLMHASKAKYLDEDTTVYRILTESASHSKDYRKKMAFGKSALQVRRAYAERYGFDDIATMLARREKRTALLMDLYDLRILNFIMSCPWKYGITFKNIVRTIKMKCHG